MSRVRIITDVTANVDPQLVARHQITLLPVEIRFGDEKFLIRRDGGRERLFRRMAKGTVQPCQATIPTRAIQSAYERLSRETDQILVILGSGRLNQAHRRAQAATRPFLGRCRIPIVDSMTASWGLGLTVEAAAQAAAQGRSLDEVVRLVRGILPHIYLVFFVERLDYLERGGRIGTAQALLGTMLGIKPILFVEDGDIVPLEKVRTRLMAIEKLVDFVAEFATVERLVILVGPLAGEFTEMIDELRDQLHQVLPGYDIPVMEYDPVLACHLGPEALGVVVYEGM